jgi:hypothetical protein
MGQDIRTELKGRIDELKTVRDEIRLDLHLATMEMKDEWKEIEGKLPSSAVAWEELKQAASDVIDALAAEVRRFRGRLKEGKPS